MKERKKKKSANDLIIDIILILEDHMTMLPKRTSQIAILL